MGFPGMPPAAPAVSKIEEERREALRKANQKFAADKIWHHYGAGNWWQLVDRPAGENDFKVEEDQSVSNIAGISSAPGLNVKGFMNDGLYKREITEGEPPNEIKKTVYAQVTNGAISPQPSPKTDEEFASVYRDLMRSVAVGMGTMSVKIDFPNLSNFSMHRLNMLMDIAASEGLAVELGSNVTKWLNDPNSVYQAGGSHSLNSKEIDKTFKELNEGREAVFDRVTEIRQKQQADSGLYRAQKAHELKRHGDALNTQKQNLSKAAKELGDAVDKNDPAGIEKALADIKKAEAEIKHTVEAVKHEIGLLDADAQHTLSAHYVGEYKKMLVDVENISSEARKEIIPVLPAADANNQAKNEKRHENINKLDAALKDKVEKEPRAILDGLDNAVKIGQEEVDKKGADIAAKRQP